MKRILSFVLTLTFVLSAVSIASVSADDYDSSNDLTSGDYTYDILENGTAAITGYTGYDTEVIIPAELDGYKVTEIHGYSFAENKNIVSVVIPEGVTALSYRVFYKCSNLKSVSLPSTLAHIKSNVFEKTRLYNDSKNWTDGVLYIGNHLVASDAEALSGTYTVKEGTIAITDSAFRGCNNLREVILPDTVQSIGELAFYECFELEKINLSDNITFMGHGALSDCKKLTQIHVPKNLTVLEQAVFAGCAFSEISLPDGLLTIHTSAFSNCINLKEIVIPETVSYIGGFAFSGCTALERIELPKNLSYLGSSVVFNTAFAENTENWDNGVLFCNNYILDTSDSLTGKYMVPNGTKGIACMAFIYRDVTIVHIPNSVKFIGESCFFACNELKEVYLPKDIKSVECYTFKECTSLTSIIIPDGVTSIGESAFFGCDSLKYIKIPASVTDIASYSIGYKESGQTDSFDAPATEIAPPNRNTSLVIAGYKGTVAENYATKNGFKFKSLDTSQKYKEKVAELLDLPLEETDNGEEHLAYYSEGYEYYITPDETGEATPDYVLISASSNMFYNCSNTKFFGDYVLYESSGSIPGAFGYHIYFPKTNQIMSLSSAYDKGVDGIYNVFTIAGVGKLIGDVNFDDKLNIRDATLIQKHLTGLADIDDYTIETGYVELVADFNRDNRLNIKDTTAIQKQLAGIS